MEELRAISLNSIHFKIVNKAPVKMAAIKTVAIKSSGRVKPLELFFNTLFLISTLFLGLACPSERPFYPF